MSCLSCGHEEEAVGGVPVQGHHLGCPDSIAMRMREHARHLVEPDFSGALCDQPGCHNPKYSASPRAKYCEEHKAPKSRKE